MVSTTNNPPIPMSSTSDRGDCFVCSKTSDYILSVQLIGVAIINFTTRIHGELSKKGIRLKWPRWFDLFTYISLAAILAHMISRILYDDRFWKSKKTTTIVNVEESWVQWSLRMGGFVFQGLLVMIAVSLGTKLANHLIEKMLLRFLPRIDLEREDDEQDERWEEKDVYDDVDSEQGNTT